MKSNAFILKVTLLLASLAYSGNIHADKPKVKGYYINKNGETLNVMIQVYTGLMSDKLSELSHQSGFKYTDKKGKNATIGFDDADEFGFTYKGENYIFRFVPKQQGLDILGPFFKGQFCRLIIDGPCELLSIKLQRSTANGSTTDDEYVLWKNKTDVYLTKTGIRKIAMDKNTLSLEELFSDCPELIAMIQNKEFKKADDKYNRMVAFYNNSCQGNDEAQESDEEEE